MGKPQRGSGDPAYMLTKKQRLLKRDKKMIDGSRQTPAPVIIKTNIYL